MRLQNWDHQNETFCFWDKQLLLKTLLLFLFVNFYTAHLWMEALNWKKLTRLGRLGSTLTIVNFICYPSWEKLCLGLLEALSFIEERMYPNNAGHPGRLVMMYTGGTPTGSRSWEQGITISPLILSVLKLAQIVQQYLHIAKASRTRKMVSQPNTAAPMKKF